MPPEKAVLEEMYLVQRMTVAKIAAHFNVRHSSARKWFTKYQIPVRPHNNNTKKWDARKEEIEFLYHHLNLSQEQIATYYGTRQAQIYRVMKRLDLPRLSRGRRKGQAHYNYKNGLHNRGYRKLMVKNECGTCGATENLGIHHKNNDHYDNRIENLEVLCNSCHMSETKKAWWAAKKAGEPLPKSNGIVGWTRKK